MPSQLTRRQWTCPRCRRTFAVPDRAETIRCACESRPRAARGPDAAADLADARREVCTACAAYSHHRGIERCVDIELGCGCEFLSRLQDPTKNCPRRKWLAPSARQSIHAERRLICASCQHARAGGCDLLDDYAGALARLGNHCPERKWEVAWREAHDSIEPRRPQLVITVGVGAHCRELLALTAPTMRRYARRCGADFVQLTHATQAWWGLEKFRVHAFARQYERTIFLDADCLVRPWADDLIGDVPAASVGLHDDAPHLPALDWAAAERPVMMTPQGVAPRHGSRLLNSGVVVCSRATADLWRPPPSAFAPTHCAEQFWVEHSAAAYPLALLPSRYNLQYWMRDFQQRLAHAHIVHLANCPPERRLELAREILAVDQSGP